MSLVNIYIRYTDKNLNLNKIATLNIDGNLVYKGEGANFKANQKTTIKFALITIASPLIAIMRLMRSVAFVSIKNFDKAKREFIGGLAYPLISSYCFFISFLSSIFYIITNGKISFYVQMRRIYAFFEAWINKINLKDPNLVSYSKRVSNPFDFIGNLKDIHKYVWTTAPCMQPVLEKGYSKVGGILDIERLQKIFPFIEINDVSREKNKVIIKSKYYDRNIHYIACKGAYEHSTNAFTCCCYRIEVIYDRFLCCEVGKGTCTSMIDSNKSCGILTCNTCGIKGGICCVKTDDELMVSGCCGIENLSFLTNMFALKKIK